jgi:hypothetical protein
MSQIHSPSVSSNTNGVVIQAIASLQPGRVQYQGTFWKARLHESAYMVNLLPGQPACILGREGLTLIVAPWHCHISAQLDLDLDRGFTSDSALHTSYAMEESLWSV